MSFEDLFESEEFLIAVFLIFSLIWIILFPLRTLLKNKIDKSLYGNNATGEEKTVHNVVIIEKRVIPHPLQKKEKIHSFLFEFENGERIELGVIDIKDVDLFYHSVVGDKGTLRYQGNKFIEFRRYKGNQQNEN